MIFSGRENRIYSNEIKKWTSISLSQPRVSDIIERKIYPWIKEDIIFYLLPKKKTNLSKPNIFVSNYLFIRRVYFENSCLNGYLR